MKISIGQNIRSQRMEKGMTQWQLAMCLRVSAQAVSKWENDRSFPDPYLLVAIADFFDISLDVLFGREPKEI